MLDFGRINILPAGDDHVLHAVPDRETSISIDDSKVSCVKPSSLECLGGCIRAIPVALHDVTRTNNYLTYLPGHHIASIGCDHANLCVEMRTATGVSFV